VPDYTIGDASDWTYSGNKLHPTQKPLSVLLPLIETFSAAGDVVWDPFAGSGSMLLAARSAGRRYVGIEIDPGYHAIASGKLTQDQVDLATYCVTGWPGTTACVAQAG
jgi:adenine-specific DNA-methyltransferase